MPRDSGRTAASVDRDQLLAEFMSLRKRGGAKHPLVANRLGPRLRQLFAISDHDTPESLCAHIRNGVLHLLADEPDRALVVLTTLNLHPAAEHPLLDGRLAWLSGHFHIDERTAQRRMTEAYEVLAERAVAASPIQHQRDQPSTESWRLRSLQVLYRLDGEVPEATEHRTIVSSQSGLDHLRYPFTLFPAKGSETSQLDVDIEELYGVRLLHIERVTPHHMRLNFALPTALAMGATHEYGVRVLARRDQPLDTVYVLTPTQGCDDFTITLRFDSQRLPAVVWRLDGALPALVQHIDPIGPVMEPDRFGEITATFQDLKAGLGYGLRWTVPATGNR